MILNNQIITTRTQLKEMLEKQPADQPVVMVNILKFKESVEGSGLSGAEMYARYSKNVMPLLKVVGGRIIWSGSVNHTVIGDSGDRPDMVAIVEYPSPAKFLEMATSDAYRAIAQDREEALIYGGLLASTTILQAG